MTTKGKGTKKGETVSRSKYIWFDWAAKNILRNKADFVVFEGLISVLVKEKVTIVELLESDSNQSSKDDMLTKCLTLCEHSRSFGFAIRTLRV